MSRHDGRDSGRDGGGDVSPPPTSAGGLAPDSGHARLRVNHRWEEAPADRLLVRFLRDDLGLTGTKEGCSEGRCGACTVLVEGRPRPACRLTAGDVEGREITTIEGLGTSESPHPVQLAFVEAGAIQCGFCTPALILETKALLDRSLRPSREQITRALGRHLCRCTGYVKIVEAVELAERYLRAEAEPSGVWEERLARDRQWRWSPAGASLRTPVRLDVVGRSETSIGALDKALGTARYAADLGCPGTLHAVAVRSPHAHARILDVLTERARMVPGVVAVLTADDVPGTNALSFFRPDQPVLASGMVRHEGEAVALVVAETPEAAFAGRASVDVRYEVLLEMLTPDEALRPGALPLHQGAANECFVMRLERDRAEQGLVGAEVVVEGTFRTPHNEHAYLEPEAGLAYLKDGCVVVEVGTQDAHHCRDQIARVLALPAARVVVQRTVMGGGFGGKLDLVLPALLGLAAHRTARPVRMVYSRGESLLVSPKRHPYRITLRVGATRSGRLTALSGEIVGDVGAYATLSPGVLSRSVLHLPGPYRAPAVSVLGRGVHTNGPPCGAMRGFGVPQVTFALECLLDVLAARLDMDPLDLRLKNALRPGDTTATGQVMDAGARYVETLEALRPAYREAVLEAEAFNGSSDAVALGLRRGAGVAGMWYGTGKTALREGARACLELLADGRVEVMVTTADLGQGLGTVLAQLVAETLALSVSSVVVSTESTDGVPDGGGTGGNRQTYYIGNAVLAAAEHMKASVLASAAEMLGKPQQVLVLRDGGAEVAGAARRITFEELYDAGIARRYQGSYEGRAGALDAHSQGIPYDAFSFGCQLAEVEVELRTGRIAVRRVTVAHDVGTALNPQAVEGQLQGGVVMGLGFALMEEYVPKATRGFSGYKIPHAADVPEIRVLPIASGTGRGPHGAAGLGECSLLPTAPAIINAVSAATGVRPRELPLTAARLRRLLEEAAHARE